jgi:lipopolysaccharide biosynthesis glycosyltransferase
MKTAILVCDWSNPIHSTFNSVVIPRLEYISKKWNSSLIKVNDLPDFIKNKKWDIKYELNKYAKLFYIEKYCKEYDRILYIDSDCVVSRDSPNMFEIFEEGYVYAALDSYDGDQNCFHRANEMISSQSFFGSINWTNGYYNSGVILIDRIHHYIFKYKQDVFLNFSDQTWFNYFLRKYGFKHRPLPRTFNSFCMNNIIGSTSPFAASPLFPEIIAEKSFIAHAAGVEEKLKNDYIFKLDQIMT